VTYLVYGDCTNAQIANLYWGTELRFPGSWVSTCIRRLVNHDFRAAVEENSRRPAGLP